MSVKKKFFRVASRLGALGCVKKSLGRTVSVPNSSIDGVIPMELFKVFLKSGITSERDWVKLADINK